jgi:hypothetical protein
LIHYFFMLLPFALLYGGALLLEALHRNDPPPIGSANTPFENNFFCLSMVFIVFYPLSVIFVTCIARLIIPAIMRERKGLLQGFQRSWLLTRTAWRKSLITLLLVTVLYLITQLPLGTLPNDPLALPELAFVCLPGRLFGLALGIVYLTQQPVVWQLADGQLTLRACADHPLAEVHLACLDGAGVVAVEVAPTDVAALWQLVKPIAKTLESIQIFVERTDGQITLVGDGFTATVPGRVLS